MSDFYKRNNPFDNEYIYSHDPSQSNPNISLLEFSYPLHILHQKLIREINIKQKGHPSSIPDADPQCRGSPFYTLFTTLSVFLPLLSELIRERSQMLLYKAAFPTV